ncbi:uncharacterized protein [Eurosta solidaginis]|uniref:uncharacterized protein isoform X3 n=1 Tax=Eurosta solidaginis TaxID=178769 RepID=UPI0035311558
MMMNEARAQRLQHGDSTKSLNREKQQNKELYTENERLKLQINEMTGEGKLENCKKSRKRETFEYGKITNILHSC